MTIILILAINIGACGYVFLLSVSDSDHAVFKEVRGLVGDLGTDKHAPTVPSYQCIILI